MSLLAAMNNIIIKQTANIPVFVKKDQTLHLVGENKALESFITK